MVCYLYGFPDRESPFGSHHYHVKGERIRRKADTRVQEVLVGTGVLPGEAGRGYTRNARAGPCMGLPRSVAPSGAIKEGHDSGYGLSSPRVTRRSQGLPSFASSPLARRIKGPRSVRTMETLFPVKDEIVLDTDAANHALGGRAGGNVRCEGLAGRICLLLSRG